jgi:hypothetical protein
MTGASTQPLGQGGEPVNILCRLCLGCARRACGQSVHLFDAPMPPMTWSTPANSKNMHGRGEDLNSAWARIGARPIFSIRRRTRWRPTHQPLRRRCRAICREPYHGVSRNCVGCHPRGVAVVRLEERPICKTARAVLEGVEQNPHDRHSSDGSLLTTTAYYPRERCRGLSFARVLSVAVSSDGDRAWSFPTKLAWR